jgi:hypothetical protein
MNEQQAKNLIKDTFENPFDKINLINPLLAKRISRCSFKPTN